MRIYTRPPIILSRGARDETTLASGKPSGVGGYEEPRDSRCNGYPARRLGARRGEGERASRAYAAHERASTQI